MVPITDSSSHSTYGFATGKRRWQQLARRFSAQSILFAVGSGEAVGGIRLAALELLHLQDLQAQEPFESADIDAMPFLDGLRADELLEHGSSLP
jgi:hypothetical protein